MRKSGRDSCFSREGAPPEGILGLPRLPEEWESEGRKAEILRSLVNRDMGKTEVGERKGISTQRPLIKAANSTGFVPPNFMEILSGILTLAAREGECVPVAKIHSILYEMYSHEPILSGLRFSLTGDVCYSRDIDQAIKNLINWRSLKIVDESALVLRGIHSFRNHLSRFFTKSQFQAIHSASLRFCDRLHRDVQGLANINSESNRIPEKGRP